MAEHPTGQQLLERVHNSLYAAKEHLGKSYGVEQANVHAKLAEVGALLCIAEAIEYLATEVRDGCAKVAVAVEVS